MIILKLIFSSRNSLIFFKPCSVCKIHLWKKWVNEVFQPTKEILCFQQRTCRCLPGQPASACTASCCVLPLKLPRVATKPRVQAAVSRSTVGPAWLPSCWATLCSWPTAVLQCPLLQGSLWGTSAPQTLAKQGGVKVLGRLLTKRGKKWIVLIVCICLLFVLAWNI